MNGATYQVRAATGADLSRIWEIRYRNDIAGDDTPPPPGEAPPYLSHVLETGHLLVSESDGAVAAYAGVIDRGGAVYLTDLFVDPACQSARHGQTLLDAAFADVPERSRFTLASVDPRAIALYTRHGMTPRWPNLLLEAPVANLRIDPAWARALSAAALDDPALHALDAQACGRRRAVDFAFWRVREGGQACWLRDDAGRSGFAVIRTGAGRLWHPEAVTIGPCAAETPELASAVTLAAVAHAATLGSYLEIAVPGPHPALRALLVAGFRIVYVETACIADPDLVDPRRAIGSGGDLF
jgi:GNAT superfamily N-acetyltransferase